MHIHTYTKNDLSKAKWEKCDKTQSRELLGLFMCVHFTVHNCLHTILHRTHLIIFAVTLDTITIAPMMSF